MTASQFVLFSFLSIGALAFLSLLCAAFRAADQATGRNAAMWLKLLAVGVIVGIVIWWVR
jgi:hypothetical protein